MSTKLPPLLSSGSPAHGNGHGHGHGKRPRVNAKVACNHCRAKKVACDGNRPKCKGCSRRKLACEYLSESPEETMTMVLKRENKELRDRLRNMENFVDNLRQLPPHIVLNMLGSEATSNFFQSVEKIPAMVASEKHTARTLLPSICSDVELELSVRHARAYPTMEHIQKGSPLENAFHAVNPDQGSIWDRLDISFWTGVPVSNEFAAGTITLYLVLDHPHMNLFDPRLFVGDLIEQSLDFCSPFLVSSLLAFASQAYSFVDPLASSKSLEFEKEAENLWQVERRDDSLASIAGLLLLFQSIGCHGQTADARKYLEAAYHMGVRMKLFDHEALPAAEHQYATDQQRRATAQTAWGAYNSITMLSVFYVGLSIKHPPLFAVPSESIEDGEDSQSVFSRSTTETFRAFCSICTIIADILAIYRLNNGQTITLAFALSRYNKLLSLADGFSPALQRTENSPSHVLILHVWIHIVTLDLFRPFVSEEKQTEFMSWQASKTKPHSIFAASVNQLKQICTALRQQHSTPYTIFSHIASLYLANAALANAADTEWRMVFLRCIDDYMDLFRAFAVALEIAQGLLALAVKKNMLTGAEARSLGQKMHSYSNIDQSIRPMRGGYMIDLDLAMSDQHAAKVDTLASQFNDLIVFDAFTDGIV